MIVNSSAPMIFEDGMMDALNELIKLAYRYHYSWCRYNNSLACANDQVGPECNCGADQHNARVKELAAILK